MLYCGVLAQEFCGFSPISAPDWGDIANSVSLAVFDGWTRALITIGLFVIIELAVSHFVEPSLYGAQTGLSALAVLLAAFFWTLLWDRSAWFSRPL